MSGVPVVIAENGFGIPINPVESNAPSMQVATNGRGVPIVISENGAPFIVQGLPVPPAFDWAQFQFTSGTDGAQWIGYSDGGADRPQPAFGTMASQPTTVTNLLAIYDDTASGNYIAVFAGDYLSLMSNLPMTVASTTYTPFDASVVNGNTWIRYTGDGDWIDAETYSVAFG